MDPRGDVVFAITEIRSEELDFIPEWRGHSNQMDHINKSDDKR